MNDVKPDERAPASATAGPRSRPAGQVAIALTVAILGFLLAIQLRAQEDLSERLAAESEQDLGRILSQLTERSIELQDEIIELRLELERATGSAEQEESLLRGARRELEALQILLGVVPVKGEGILVTIEDPKVTVGAELLLDAVQELRDAGAEAIEINAIRVVASTAFTGDPGALRVGGTLVVAPYHVRAIGASATLAEAMRIPGGVVDAIGGREGASVRIEQQGSVHIQATSRLPTYRYARPRPRR